MRAATESRSGHARVARGLTIVELMVALVVGLLISLAAVLSAQQFLASQRQGIGVGSGGANAGSALASIKNDVANGGLGFFGDSSVPCTTLNLGRGAIAVSDGANFSPVQVTRVAGNDRLDVVYGSEVAAGAAVSLALLSDGTSATLRTLLPTTVGQTVLLSPDPPASPCLVRSVTAVTAPTVTDQQVISFANTGDLNQAVFTTPSVLDEDSRITLLGRLQWNRYALAAGNLTVTRVLTGESATLMRNVIGFRVEYGLSSAAANSTTLEDWQDADTFGAVTSANIGRVRALRIGVVVRSAQREKADDGVNCTASAAKPTLFGDTIEPDVDDWRCYRYRSTIVVAPMRNIIYGMM